MLHTITLGDNQWIHITDPNYNEIHKLQKKYQINSLIHEDMIELSSEQKVDRHDDNLYVLINFLKYNPELEKYILNEATIVIGKKHLISVMRFPSHHLDQYIKQCEENAPQLAHMMELLYQIINTMYTKTIDSIHLAGQDIFRLQDSMIYQKKSEKEFLDSLMTQKINMIALLHNFKPHKELLSDLVQFATEQQIDISIYFSNLTAKLDKIIANTSMLYETTEALINTYNALMNMNTNSLITTLTIFTAIIGTCNLIVGTYGMNIPLP